MHSMSNGVKRGRQECMNFLRWSRGVQAGSVAAAQDRVTGVKLRC